MKMTEALNLLQEKKKNNLLATCTEHIHASPTLLVPSFSDEV